MNFDVLKRNWIQNYFRNIYYSFIPTYDQHNIYSFPKLPWKKLNFQDKFAFPPYLRVLFPLMWYFWQFYVKTMHLDQHSCVVINLTLQMVKPLNFTQLISQWIPWNVIKKSYFASIDNFIHLLWIKVVLKFVLVKLTFYQRVNIIKYFFICYCSFMTFLLRLAFPYRTYHFNFCDLF